ncbi:hypothetical protein RHMOL_Rhmol05G0084900 [Rhododendron molle]|uniref:Uncharacterized protein n=1 Tax=Rhododendron molle TaxID=49168 RepID=A0ACC0NND1_RHOML|nr:hypothetical protein RHMOL_Rhmol05G0084900 [Rhododendron molle]
MVMAMSITSSHFSATCTHKTLSSNFRTSTKIQFSWAGSIAFSSTSSVTREMWGSVKSKNGVGTGRRRMHGVIRAEMFGQLTSGLEAAWSKLKGEEVLTTENIVEPMKDIRRALLEADVSLPVVRRFVQAVSEQAVGVGLIRGVTPDQQLVKVCNPIE